MNQTLANSFSTSFDLTVNGYYDATLTSGSTTLATIPGVHGVSPFSLAFSPINTLSAFSIQVLPEPPTALLLGAGLAGLAALGRRRKAVTERRA